MAAVVALSFIVIPIQAQDNLRFSGEVFSDYFYVFSSLDGQGDGENGFTYRRARLTTDAKLSDQFNARFRLEAKDVDGSSSKGPNPFVKDLFLTWNDALGIGHRVVLGLSPSVAWQPGERVWGYRSVSKTLQDRAGVHSSRDIGVAIYGPLAVEGKIRYGVMIGNANGTRAENDKYKRVYGQVEFYPNDRLTVTVGGNYEAIEEGYAYNVNGFAGFRGDGFRVGVEGFFHPTVYDDRRPSDEQYGMSAFVVYDASEKYSLILRADAVERPEEFSFETELFALFGVAFKPESNVQFIPMVRYLTLDGAKKDSISAQFTLWFKF